jgi:hypothetical protein
MGMERSLPPRAAARIACRAVGARVLFRHRHGGRQEMADFEYTVEGQVGLMRFNRPEKMNAIT